MGQSIELQLRAFEAKAISQTRPEVPRPPMHIDRTGHAEEVELVQRVFLLPAREAPRVVVFCGVGQIDGGAGICARAAENLACLTGCSVCVAEGDCHSPSLHRHFGLDNSRGLTDAVLESGPIRDFVCLLPGTDLAVLAAGSRCREAQAVWKSGRLQYRIAELRREFSYVLIYGPHVSQKDVDAALLGQIADGVILILESMVTRRDTARMAKENLTGANVKILGAVLNNHTFSIPDTLYRRL